MYLVISGYIRLSQAILSYLLVSWAILGYLEVSRAILSYLRYSLLSLAISCYLLLSLVNLLMFLAISGYLYQVSSIRVQFKVGESKLLLFETFPLFFHISQTRVIEELALLKIVPIIGFMVFKSTVSMQKTVLKNMHRVPRYLSKCIKFCRFGLEGRFCTLFW